MNFFTFLNTEKKNVSQTRLTVENKTIIADYNNCIFEV